MPENHQSNNAYLKRLFEEVLSQSTPYDLVNDFFRESGPFDRLECRDCYAIATGKASYEMIEAIQQVCGERFKKGFCIGSHDPGISFKKSNIIIKKGSHPTPTSKSLQAAEGLIQFIRQIPGGSAVFYGISGGTSSLCCLPADGISIDELTKAYQLLNNSGATIREINTVRKHCSKIKGGQLLRYFGKDTALFDLVISDVPGDDLEIIGSGPTTPDSSTFQDAYDILHTYGLYSEFPASVQNHIKKGLAGEVSETLKPGKKILQHHESTIIGSAKKLAQKAAKLADEKGLDCWVSDSAYNADVKDIASMITQKAFSAIQDRNVDRDKALLIIYYGESTVEVHGEGKGGRNQELALRGALGIADNNHITWLSAGTDGIDGPTDAAGAVVDGKTIGEGRKKGLDPESYLKNNDSYHFHEQLGTLLKTGPTGNNLMDLQLILID